MNTILYRTYSVCGLALARPWEFDLFATKSHPELWESQELQELWDHQLFNLNHLTMSKRPAELPLEQDFSGSPVSKKARVEDDNDYDSLNGAAYRSSDEEPKQNRNGVDIQGAAEIEGEELEEGEKDPSGFSDIDEDAPALSAPKRQIAPMEGYGDLYLDTINREILDFDFEKLCSISLSNINVYACLVCGKYFQGRGPKSHAYFHALEVGHHVFINIGTKKVYVLPEGYEVNNKSLEDIKYVVDPHYTKNQVVKLDKEVHDAWDLSGSRYRPGKSLYQYNTERFILANCFSFQGLWA